MSFTPPSQMPLPDMIKKKEHFDTFSPTRINLFQTCPRRFFYEYILGWSSEFTSIHLTFGSAIHIGMAHLVQHHLELKEPVKQKQLLEEAFTLFYQAFQADTSTMMEGDLPKNKTEAMAANLFQNWILTHGQDEFEPLFCEVVGSIPVTEHQRINFVIDAIVNHKQLGICNFEHKTSSRNTAAWRDSWLTALQPKVYTQALYFNFPASDVFGTIINGLMCTQKAEIIPILVNETPPMMAEFFWHLRYKVKEIHHNFEALAECKEEDPIMMAFPKNTTGCTSYGVPCPYLQFCSAWANPLQKASTPPIGFIEKNRDSQKEKEASAKFSMTENGIEKIEPKEEPKDVTVTSSS